MGGLGPFSRKSKKRSPPQIAKFKSVVRKSTAKSRLRRLSWRSSDDFGGIMGHNMLGFEFFKFIGRTVGLSLVFKNFSAHVGL